MQQREQSAVDWLCNEWLYLDQQFDMCLIDKSVYWDKLRQVQEKAKEMEKENIKKERIEAYSNGYANGQKDAFTN